MGEEIKAGNSEMACLGEKEDFTEVSKPIYMVQWLGIHLPMQGTWVRTLVGELGSHMAPETKSTDHNY